MDIKEILLKNKKKAVQISTGMVFIQDIVLNRIANELNNGVKIIQFLAKNATDQQNIDTAFKIRQLCSMYDALLIINSRVDIAQLTKADGVCLMENDMSIKQAREVMHSNLIVAKYSKKLEDLIDAAKNNADYICYDYGSKDALKSNFKALNRIKLIELEKVII